MSVGHKYYSETGLQMQFCLHSREGKKITTLTVYVSVTNFEMNRKSEVKLSPWRYVLIHLVNLYKCYEVFVSRSNKYLLCTKDLCSIFRSTESNAD